MTGKPRTFRARDRTALLIGGIASVLLHGAVLIPGLTTVLASEPPIADLDPNFDPRRRESPPDEQPDESVDLGIDAETDAKLTWIGYDTYQEHIAQQAEIEQAAMKADEAAGAPPSPEASVPEEATPEEVVEAEAAPPEEAPEATDAAEPEPVDPVPPQPSPLPVDETAPAEQPAAEEPAEELQPDPLEEVGEREPEAAPVEVTSDADSEAETPEDPTDEAPTETETPDVVTEPQPQPTPEVQPTPPSPQPAPPGEAGDSEPQEGDPSDRESPATSIEVPLDALNTGRPLAAPGLELRPRRPNFTTLTRLTAAPGNPLVEIHFRRDHRPKLARIVGPSGDVRIDNAIKASLYRWRAYGKQIDALTGDEVVIVQIRIILNPRAK